jgi:hypothetical protein
MSLCCNNSWTGIRQLINGDVTQSNITLITTHSGESGTKIRTIRAQGLDKESEYECCFIRTGTKDFTEFWFRILHLFEVCMFSKFFNIMYSVRPLGRPRRRWVDNIKMDLREIGWDDMDWIDLAQDRDQWRAYLNALMNLRVP